LLYSDTRTNRGSLLRQSAIHSLAKRLKKKPKPAK
jgi:hypothetical protein